MLKPIYQKQFEKDVKQIKKRGKKITKLKDIISLLILKKTLSVKNHNHKLKGEYQRYWECHIEADWLLVYKKNSTTIIFVRTGTHSDLF